MAEETKPNVLLFGAGGVGAVYLYLLSRVSSITAVCRSNFDVVKASGFIIHSSLFGENIHITPNVVRNCSEAASTADKPFDLILVCSKAIPDAIPALIALAVTPGHTVICLLQNGIGIEQEYVEKFPDNPIVSCVVYLPATQRPLGTVRHGEIERLEIGPYPSTASPIHAKRFQELVKAAGGTAEVHEDVQLKRWTKLLINASWNPVCALTQCTDTEFMASSPGAVDFIFGVMMEVVELGRAYGTAISREDAEMQLGRAKARTANGMGKGVEPSMLQDVRAGRRMEVEAIVGNALALAKEKGVEVPKLEMLYVLLKALDSKIGNAIV